MLYATLNCVQKIEKKFAPKLMNVILRSFHKSDDLMWMYVFVCIMIHGIAFKKIIISCSYSNGCIQEWCDELS